MERVEITCDKNRVVIALNGERVIDADLTGLPNLTGVRRTTHKFDVAYRDHPRLGYTGLQATAAHAGSRTLLRPLPQP